MQSYWALGYPHMNFWEHNLFCSTPIGLLQMSPHNPSGLLFQALCYETMISMASVYGLPVHWLLAGLGPGGTMERNRYEKRELGSQSMFCLPPCRANMEECVPDPTPGSSCLQPQGFLSPPVSSALRMFSENTCPWGLSCCTVK